MPVQSETVIYASDPILAEEPAPAPPNSPAVPTMAEEPFEDPKPVAEEAPAIDPAPAVDPAPAPVEEVTETVEDDLFGPAEAPEESPEETLPDGSGVESESTEEPKEESSEIDDLFGHQEVFDTLVQAGGLESQATKVWTDDTGLYQCEASMLQVKTSAVVLVKPSGAKATVPLSRLSDADLRFVQQQVTAKREMLAQRAAVEKLAAN